MTFLDYQEDPICVAFLAIAVLIVGLSLFNERRAALRARKESAV